MKTESVDFSDETIKKYLYSFKTENKIHDAGRGWYSTIKEPFRLDTTSVKEIVNSIKKQFPLLPFSVWSTKQIKSYFHHLQTKFVTFVFSETDYLTTLFDTLRERYSNVYLNPKQEEARKNFVIRESTFVMRPSVTEEPEQNNFAAIEKILVDLFLEKDRLNLVDASEYNRIFNNAIYSSRINIAVLLHYAKMRGVKNEILSQIH